MNFTKSMCVEGKKKKRKGDIAHSNGPTLLLGRGTTPPGHIRGIPPSRVPAASFWVIGALGSAGMMALSPSHTQENTKLKNKNEYAIHLSTRIRGCIKGCDQKKKEITHTLR